MSTELIARDSEITALAPVENVNSLLTLAIERNVPVETMEKLLAMRDKLKGEYAREQFFAALRDFQQRCPIIPKNNTAGSGNFAYRYAALDTIIEIVRPLLGEVGLSYTFNTRDTDTEKITVCMIHHVAGHSESSEFKVPIDKGARMNDTQKHGSANTYAKRYAFCDALGIMTGEQDDDAQALTKRPEPAPAPKPEEQPKEPPKRIGQYQEFRAVQLERLMDQRPDYWFLKDGAKIKPEEWFNDHSKAIAANLGYKANPVTWNNEQWTAMQDALAGYVNEIIAGEAQ